MLKHIVLFKVAEFAETKSRKENCKIIYDLLSSLPPKIPEIIGYEFGINTAASDNAADIAVVSTFNSIQELEIYKNHPAHIEVVEYIRKVAVESRVVDFSF